jgi:short-subunit dehydrogenase
MTDTMQRSPAGLVAIVTGASSGIGEATARELARRGVRVALAARRADRLETVVRSVIEAGGAAIGVPADVGQQEDIERLVARVKAEWSQVDVLVNAAGQGWNRAFARLAPDTIVGGVGVNLLGTMLLTRAVLPGMLERRQGHVINVASVAGQLAFGPLYSATKFGVRGFTLALRRELAGTGVRVSVVSPGFIRTEMTKGERGLPMPGPEGLARAIANLVTHPRRELVYPRLYYGAIWLERLLPGLVDLGVRPRQPRSG